MRVRNLIYPVAAVLLSACSLAQTAPFAKSAPAHTPPISVLPYTVAFHGMVFMQGSVNGHPLSLLFDTGSHGAINSRWVRATGLSAQGGYQASGSGPAMVQASMLRNSTWRIGGAQIQTDTVVLDLTDLEAVFGRTIDGIVGTDFLRHYVVELDPPSRQFRIYNPDTFQPMAGAARIPLEFDNNGYPAIAASIRVGDKQATGTFMADTGSNGAIDLYLPFARENGLLTSVNDFDELSTGVGGQRHNAMERISELRIADFAVSHPIAAINETDDTATSHRYAGLIGMEIWSRFVLAVDFSHKAIDLSPLPTLGEPFPSDTCGLRLRATGIGATGNDFGRVEITRVVAHSAAEAAGVKPGDLLRSVNGHDAGKMGLEAIREKCHQSGSLDLILERKGSEVKAHLALKPLV